MAAWHWPRSALRCDSVVVSWAAGDAADGEDALAAPKAVDCVEGGAAAQRLRRSAPFCCTPATALTGMSASAAFRLELLAPAAGSAGRWRVSIRASDMQRIAKGRSTRT